MTTNKSSYAHCHANEQSEDDAIALEVLSDALRAANVQSRNVLEMGGQFVVVEIVNVDDSCEIALYISATVTGVNKRGEMRCSFDMSECDFDGYTKEIGTLKSSDNVVAYVVGRLAMQKR